ncbi:MAG: VWA domain-containing protein [Pyrinomonadaceae bacterium]
MKKTIRIFSFEIFLALLLISPLYAQQTQTNDEVVKVSTNLVQVDAIVTDKNGNPITNLTANDFEIFQDGKPQTITNLSYVKRNANTEAANQNQAANKPDKNTPLPPVVSNRSPEFGRILTFVIDDGGCDATSAGITAIRSGLEKFINEQMQPNDSVAIYRTRAGSSLLQQYISDKSQLLNIVRKIRWYPPNGICNNITGTDYEPARDNSTGKPTGAGTFESDRDKQNREAITDSTKDRQVAGVIGVLKYAINGLQRVGGRKILFLMSDSLPISNGKITFPNALDAARDLTALANRAAVVINTIDDRGLNAPMVQASDYMNSVKEDVLAADKVVSARAADDDTRQSGLFYAANETGGKFYKNMNFLDNPIKQALQSETGYYLIGYQPDEDTFKGKKFHKIEIKLKRPDLISSSRSGFYGITDDAMRPKPRTGDSELYDALSAPLPNADMNVQLSAYFANTPDKGNIIHAVLYIDGKDISFVNDADGKKKAVFDIVAVTLDEKNKVIDDSNHTNTVHIPLEQAAQIQQNGLIYTVDVPVKNAGVYTFRTALRDAATKKLGSASQVIEVPDLKKDKLFVSGLILSGVDANGKIYPPDAAKADNDFSTVVSKAIPAIRQFRRSSIVAYAYSIYNAKVDATAN